jgi:hypothetical protein
MSCVFRLDISHRNFSHKAPAAHGIQLDWPCHVYYYNHDSDNEIKQVRLFTRPRIFYENILIYNKN